MEYYQVILEPPERLVKAAAFEDEELVWRFMGQTPEQVGGLLERAGLTLEEMSRLMNPEVAFLEGENFLIRPPLDLVLELSRPKREVIYAELRRWDVNRLYSRPFTMTWGGFGDMAADSNLDRAVIEQVERLSYNWGQTKVFSDLPAIFYEVRDQETRFKIIRTLLRTRTHVLRLRVSPDSDLDALAEYWSAGTKNKDVVPILESIARTPGVETLDVVHLLPATPRKLLYSFAVPEMSLNWKFPDCFWTAFNFFNYEPYDRHLDLFSIEAYLGTKYERASKPYRYGDLVFFSNPDTGEAIHACVYIADDIVLTKNGLSMLRPWVLMNIDDVIAGYLKTPRVSMHIFRERDEP